MLVVHLFGIDGKNYHPMVSVVYLHRYRFMFLIFERVHFFMIVSLSYVDYASDF